MGKKSQYLKLSKVIDKFSKNLRANKPPVLDEYDLRQVQDGYLGMRSWNNEEKRLVTASKKIVRRNKWIKYVLLATLIIFAIIALWQWILNQRNANIALARLLGIKITSIALQSNNNPNDSYNNDLDLGFLLAVHAIDIVPKSEKEEVEEAKGYLKKMLASPKHKASLYRQGSEFSFSLDNKRMVIGAPDGSVRFWDLTTGVRPQIIRVQQGHQSLVSGVQFSADGRFAVTHDYSGRGIVWDIFTGKKVDIALEHIDLAQEVPLNPNEQITVKTDCNGVITIRDKTTGKLKDDLQMEHGGRVSAMQFSEDAQTVITGGFGGNIAIWDASELNWRKIESQQIHQDKVIDIQFSANGRLLVTIGEDGSVAFWDTSNWEVLQDKDQNQNKEQTCLLTGRNLTREEWATHIGKNRRYKIICSQYPTGF